MQGGTLAWGHSCCTKLVSEDAAQKWKPQLISHGIASENPAHIRLRHQLCPSLCFRPGIRRSFLTTAEWCQEQLQSSLGRRLQTTAPRSTGAPWPKPSHKEKWATTATSVTLRLCRVLSV